MKTSNDFKETDKSMSNSIMEQLKGKIITVKCTDCDGTGHYPSSGEECQKCNGKYTLL